MDAKTILEMIHMLVEACGKGDQDIAYNNISALNIYAKVAPGEFQSALALIQQQIDYLGQTPTKENENV